MGTPDPKESAAKKWAEMRGTRNFNPRRALERILIDEQETHNFQESE